MTRFGTRVTATAAAMIDNVTGTFTLVDNLLNQSGVPGDILASCHRGGRGGRVGYLERVLDRLDEEDPTRLQVVLQELISRLNQGQRLSQIDRMSAALRERGFELTDDARIHPIEILAEESEETDDYLDELIATNQNHLTINILRHHLDQHRNLYAQGTSPGAATGEARQFVEQLLVDIARAIADARSHVPNLSRPVRVREYLQDQGFFDEDELKRLVVGVYGYLSEVGAHPGVTDVAMGRMARAIFLNFGVYLLEKFQAFDLSTLEG